MALTKVTDNLITGPISVANGGTGVATASANTVFSGPTSGGAVAPAFRALVGGDIPTAAQSDQETATSTTLFVTPGRQQFHPSAAKGWVKANSVGGALAAYNVTSLVDGGVGRLQVNWTIAFSSTAYSTVSTAQLSTSLTAATTLVCQQRDSSTASTTDIDIIAVNGTQFADPSDTAVVAFGDQ